MNTKTIIKNALILFCITLVAGLSLSFVHAITADPIAKTEQKARETAYKSVFEDAEAFEEIDNSEAIIEKFNASLSQTDYPGVSVSGIQKAMDKSGNVAGVIVTAASSKGYAGKIELVIGVSKDGTLNGISVLSMNESPGLGAKCTTAEFQDQFKGINAEKVKFTKDGATADDEIDAISGATITTKAVTNAVNAGLELAKSSMAELK